MAAKEAIQEMETVFALNFTSPTVTILLGPEESPFHVHKSVLTVQSEYFKRIFAGSWSGREVAENTVRLNEAVDTHDAFLMFVEYLYMGDYTVPKAPEAEDGRFLTHARVYVFAERVCVDRLKVLAAKKMRAELAGAYSVPEAVNDADDSTDSCYNCGSRMDSCYNCGSRTAPCSNCGSRTDSCYNCGSRTDCCYKCGSRPDSCFECGSRMKPRRKERGTREPVEPNEATIQGLSGYALSTTTMVELVAIIYPYTLNRLEDSDEANKTAKERTEANLLLAAQAGEPSTSHNHNRVVKHDAMRALVSQYAASQLDIYSKDDAFIQAVMDYPDFAGDLVALAAKGSRLTAT